MLQCKKTLRGGPEGVMPKVELALTAPRKGGLSMTLPLEIERKFLVLSEEWRDGGTPMPIHQAYFMSDDGVAVRVRTVGEVGYLTVKAKKKKASQFEFEYRIPTDHAEFLIHTVCKRTPIIKHRYRVRYAGLDWDVDVFEGENAGLVIAEVELVHEDQPVVLPPWVGAEVTDEKRFRNSQLYKKPVSAWKEDLPPPMAAALRPVA